MQGRAAAETSVSIDILETGNPIEFGDTLANQVFRRLQGDILSGRFAPGTKLRQKDLGDDYGTSGSAIREALTQLVSIGLVVAEPQRGFRVAEASIANLMDLTKSRCWVEAIALRSAIARGGRDWEAAIVAAAHMLGREQPKRGAKAKSSEPFDTIDSQWRQDHQNYHDTLISACDLTSLLTYRRNLIQLNERYRRLSSLILVRTQCRRRARRDHRVRSWREIQTSRSNSSRHTFWKRRGEFWRGQAHSRAAFPKRSKS